MATRLWLCCYMVACSDGSRGHHSAGEGAHGAAGGVRGAIHQACGGGGRGAGHCGLRPAQPHGHGSKGLGAAAPSMLAPPDLRGSVAIKSATACVWLQMLWTLFLCFVVVAVLGVLAYYFPLVAATLRWIGEHAHPSHAQAPKSCGGSPNGRT